MKQIRVRVVLLICWLAVFYSLERLLESLKESRFTYTIAIIMVMVALIFPRISRIPKWLVIAAPLPPMLVYKALVGTLVQGYSVPIIFMEVSFISLALILAVWVNKAINEFESTVEHITIGDHDKKPATDSEGKALLYREVRRARNHQRPLTLMKVGIDEESIEIALDRMVQKAQQAMKKQYALSIVSKTLCDKLEDSDIIVQKKDFFLIILPETKPEHIPGVIERLRKQVSEKVGVNLKIGSASLPRDGLTLEGLLDKADMNLESIVEQDTLFEMDRLFIKHNSL